MLPSLIFFFAKADAAATVDFFLFFATYWGKIAAVQLKKNGNLVKKSVFEEIYIINTGL